MKNPLKKPNKTEKPLYICICSQWIFGEIVTCDVTRTSVLAFVSSVRSPLTSSSLLCTVYIVHWPWVQYSFGQDNWACDKAYVIWYRPHGCPTLVSVVRSSCLVYVHQRWTCVTLSGLVISHTCRNKCCISKYIVITCHNTLLH